MPTDNAFRGCQAPRRSPPTPFETDLRHQDILRHQEMLALSFSAYSSYLNSTFLKIDHCRNHHLYLVKFRLRHMRCLGCVQAL